MATFFSKMMDEGVKVLTRIALIGAALFTVIGIFIGWLIWR